MTTRDKRPYKEVNFSRSGDFRVWSIDCPEASLIAEQLLPNPEAVLERGTPLLGRGSSCQAYRMKFAGKDYFVKRYHVSGATYSYRYAFRQSRARRVWRASLQFMDFGVPVARPLILMERRRFRLLGDAYMVTEFCSDYRSLKELWNTVDREEQTRLVRQTATALAKIHNLGFIHGDTNWDNILFSRQGMAPPIIFVDLDCAKVLRKFSRERTERDLSHFVRDLCRDENQGSDRVGLFLDGWQEDLQAEGRDIPNVGRNLRIRTAKRKK